MEKRKKNRSGRGINPCCACRLGVQGWYTDFKSILRSLGGQKEGEEIGERRKCLLFGRRPFLCIALDPALLSSLVVDDETLSRSDFNGSKRVRHLLASFSGQALCVFVFLHYSQRLWVNSCAASIQSLEERFVHRINSLRTLLSA